jgi:response regulator RpfG family c-di-GMP phosphodiesterase
MVKQIYYSSLLFELGKLALPENLLETPIELLDVEDYEQLMRYPEIGASVLKDIANFTDTARIIEHHFEYLDGSGGPDALTADEIPVGCKVLSIIKDFFLLQSGKFDGIKHTAKDARSFLFEKKGKLYDAELVMMFNDLSKKLEKDNNEIEELMVNTMQLQADMVLSRDCINSSGLLLLNKGVRLTEEHIKRLLTFEKVYDMPLTFYIRS